MNLKNELALKSNPWQMNYSLSAIFYLWFGYWNLFVIWCLRFVIFGLSGFRPLSGFPTTFCNGHRVLVFRCQRRRRSEKQPVWSKKNPLWNHEKDPKDVKLRYWLGERLPAAIDSVRQVTIIVAGSHSHPPSTSAKNGINFQLWPFISFASNLKPPTPEAYRL